MRQFAKVAAIAEQVARRGVHPAAEAEPFEALRHRAFAGGHLLAGVAPFAALPALLAFGVAPSGAGFAPFLWGACAILTGLALLRSGDLFRATALSAFAFSALVGLIAAGSGGLSSLALLLLALPLIEAGMSGSRRALGAASVAILLTLLGVAGAQMAGISVKGPGLLGIGVAAVYALTLSGRAFALVSGAAAEARRLRASLNLVSGAASDLVTRHTADGSATYASTAAQRLLGASARELMGHGLFDRVHIADRPAFLQTLGAAGAGEGPRPAEIRLRAGEDQTRAPRFVWVEMRARLVDPAETAGETVVVASFRDVSESRAQAEALIAARDEADRANVAKTRFLANMSHELRTPLNAIIGFSEILSDDNLRQLGPERRADYAALIHKSGAHLLEVVNSILDMAKIESGAFSILREPCEIEPVVAHCVSLMALKAEEAEIAVGVKIDRPLPAIRADTRALTQILLNLLSNAIKFTPKGGRIDVAVEHLEDRLALIVRDTGVGVAPEHIARLGEAFFQCDSSYKRGHEGAGLGLSVVRGLVALHGGELKVESAPGCGARFAVLLPVEAQAARPTPIHRADRVRLRA
ncbi:ATP-binding protein [Hansschlegelia quercus]|uniref:sensor histidine kinase n=1 Tax=Hansschlegelia quercus TaxID=2528245 RepID=UPI0026C1C339